VQDLQRTVLRRIAAPHLWYPGSLHLARNPGLISICQRFTEQQRQKACPRNHGGDRWQIRTRLQVTAAPMIGIRPLRFYGDQNGRPKEFGSPDLANCVQ